MTIKEIREELKNNYVNAIEEGEEKQSRTGRDDLFTEFRKFYLKNGEQKYFTISKSYAYGGSARTTKKIDLSKYTLSPDEVIWLCETFDKQYELNAIKHFYAFNQAISSKKSVIRKLNKEINRLEEHIKEYGEYWGSLDEIKSEVKNVEFHEKLLITSVHGKEVKNIVHNKDVGEVSIYKGYDSLSKYALEIIEGRLRQEHGLSRFQFP